jgi:DNA-binding CsgD family transcriptional regulator
MADTRGLEAEVAVIARHSLKPQRAEIVLTLREQGHTWQEIAQSLGMKRDTVMRYTRRLRRRAGIPGRRLALPGPNTGQRGRRGRCVSLEGSGLVHELVANDD